MLVDIDLGCTFTLLDQVKTDIIKLKELANLVGLNIVRVLVIAVNDNFVVFFWDDCGAHVLERK